jgi:hypothetical protein
VAFSRFDDLRIALRAAKVLVSGKGVAANHLVKPTASANHADE